MKKLYLISLLILMACSEDDPKEVESLDIFFEIDRTTLNSPSAGKEFELSIVSNSSWKINSHPEWITASSDSGEGNSVIQVNVLQNPDGEIRKGELVFQYSGKIHRLTITQEGASLKLISYSGFESPLRLDEPKYLLFNKPVNLNYIMSGDERYSFLVQSNDVEYFDDKRGIKFTTGPSYLGSDHSYKFSVTDDDNIKKEGLVDFLYYTQKEFFPGAVRKVILDEENNIWVLSIKGGENAEPSYIFKFSETEGLYEQKLKFEIDLDYSSGGFVGGDFFINPYNDLIYVPNYMGEKIEVYSQSGELIKEITIDPGSSDHPDHPNTSPYSIGFIKSGQGIVALAGKGISGIKWRFIDSSNDDVMTEPFDSYPYYYGDLQTFQLNHDHSKLFVLEDRSPVIKIFNGGREFEEINMKELYPTGADAVRISTNRLNNKIYVAGLYNQQIIAEDLSYQSLQSYAQFYMGDFYYDEAFPNHIYALNHSTDVSLELLDYNNQKTIKSYPVNKVFNWTSQRGLITTPNDRFVIIFAGSQMIICNTEMFK